MTPVIRNGPSTYQTNHDRMCQLLRKVLVDGVQARRGAAGGIGSVQLRACATVYGLLLDHPIDRQGRCRSCRCLGAVFGSRWRHRRVYGKANLWLHQVNEALLPRLLAHELGLAAAPPPAAPGRAPARDPDGTNVLSTIAADPPTQPSLQTPAVPPPTARAGRSDPAHGGAGDDPPMASGLAVFHLVTRPRPSWTGPLCYQEVRHGRHNR